MSPSEDPLGRRALFGPPASTAGDPPTDGSDVGRRAFFSEAAPSWEPPAPAVVRVMCRSCRATTDLSPGRALRALLGSLWWPLGAWNHRMRCPACGRVGWCRVEWSGMIDWR